MTPTDVDLWEDLLLAVEDGQVVPVVGRELLVVESGGETLLFHHLVARQLAAELRIPTPNLRDGFDTHDVVCAYENFHGDPMAINPRVVRILKTIRISVPEPLRLLASIPQFRLFVSTTIDNLLEEAIKAERGRPPAVVAFPAASALTDFDDALLERHGSLVFHVLGKGSASSPFAVTEGQMLLVDGARVRVDNG